MATLYVASTERLAGKTAFCAGLARLLGHAAKKVGYMKPVSSNLLPHSEPADEDVLFLKKVLDLPDPLESMAPAVVHSGLLGSPASDAVCRGLRQRIGDAQARISEGRDVVLAEGAGNLREGMLVDLGPAQVADLLRSAVVLVVKHESDQQLLEDSLAGRVRFADRLAGVVLNSVPRPRLDFAEEVAKPALEGRGIAVLGVLPLERHLQSITVQEIAEALCGQVIGESQLDELVEHVMVGAMSAGTALSHFRLKPNKAVITGWDRIDVQYAALETSTKCLILTGGQEAPEGVRRRAEELGVPLVLVRQDTMAAAQGIEHAFGRTRCHHDRKVDLVEQMLAERLDLGRVTAALDAG